MTYATLVGRSGRMRSVSVTGASEIDDRSTVSMSTNVAPIRDSTSAGSSIGSVPEKRIDVGRASSSMYSTRSSG
ncbi:hypothetical protein QNA15_23425 [Rhodococcus fascians]|nr:MULTISPECIES: hypothetical protein [Rhodococcus]MDJ0412473.1 hypothetical protein [Rhodococcus fascians]